MIRIGLHSQLTALTDAHEQWPKPWSINDAPDAFIAMQMRAIVGIEIAITKFPGKWKVSQNRPVADRTGVAEGLAATDKMKWRIWWAAIARFDSPVVKMRTFKSIRVSSITVTVRTQECMGRLILFTFLP